MLRYVCIAGVVSAGMALGGCAGRAPQIPPLTLATDSSLSCETIRTEAELNTEKMADLAVEQNLKLGQNVVAGVTGFMIWPAWLALDFQNAAAKEGRALSQRNRYLATLADERCGTQAGQATVADLPLAPNSDVAAWTSPEISTSLVSY